MIVRVSILNRLKKGNGKLLDRLFLRVVFDLFAVAIENAHETVLVLRTIDRTHHHLKVEQNVQISVGHPRFAVLARIGAHECDFVLGHHVLFRLIAQATHRLEVCRIVAASHAVRQDVVDRHQNHARCTDRVQVEVLCAVVIAVSLDEEHVALPTTAYAAQLIFECTQALRRDLRINAAQVPVLVLTGCAAAANQTGEHGLGRDHSVPLHCCGLQDVRLGNFTQMLDRCVNSDVVHCVE